MNRAEGEEEGNWEERAAAHVKHMSSMKKTIRMHIQRKERRRKKKRGWLGKTERVGGM